MCSFRLTLERVLAAMSAALETIGDYRRGLASGASVSITDLGLNELRMDLVGYYRDNPDIDRLPSGINAVVEGCWRLWLGRTPISCCSRAPSSMRPALQ